MKGGKIFVDTNIIVYAYDVLAVEKHEIATRIMEDLWRSGFGILSTQVLQEFFVVITEKITAPLDVRTAKEIVSDLLKWDIVINDGESILDAIEVQQHYQYSFWDSLIIQAAIKGNAYLLLSEDFKDGHEVEGLKIENPFIH